MKKKIDAKLQTEIDLHRKNKLDISSLIQDYDIRNTNLSGTIIKEFNRPDDDISGVNLTNAVIGEEGKTINLNRVIARNCNFTSTMFKGLLSIRRADLSYSILTDAYMANMDYKFCNFEHCNMCGAIFQISTPKGIGAKFSEDFFKSLAKYWSVEIIKKPQSEEK